MQWLKFLLSLFPEQRSRKIPGPAIAISRYFAPDNPLHPAVQGSKAFFYFVIRNNALSLHANSNEQGDRPVSENHIQRK